MGLETRFRPQSRVRDPRPVAAALGAARWKRCDAKPVLRTAKPLVSLNRDLARSERGRCEILEAAAYGLEPGAVCSLIRICPWLEQNSNSYWSDQAGPPQGQVRPGQLASHKQEFFTT